ncbi:nucleotidyltransferase family protein [Kitasatospora sp. NBC_01560]|uniref:nucleotidyltransferase family protein n=1 Tax=Kitasatospora sp. NBC_01560 TaxID=2975965 RepID=UPI00386BF778
MAEELGGAERELILACLVRDPALDARICELAGEALAWSDLFLAALWHKVAFLVYTRLQTTGALDLALVEGNLHLLLLNHWKQLQKVNALRSELYATAAVEICAIAEQAGVDLAVSKGGIAMFGREYSRIERKTYDVDFIGRRDELRGIEEVFRRGGFAYGEYSHSREAILPPRQDDLRKYLFQGRGLPNLLRKVDSGPVDYLVAQVRFRVGSGTTHGNWVPAERLLERSESREGIRVVSRPDLALQLALHLHREATEIEYQSWNLDWNLVKICDFQRVVQDLGGQAAVEELVERAAELGFTSELGFAAGITALLFPSEDLDGLLALLDKPRGSSGGPGPARPAVDEATVWRAIWSVGVDSKAQRGAWVQIAGAKTT